MPALRWNDTEVSTSFLTQRAYRAAYCTLLVNVTPENRESALEAYRESERDFSGLRLSGIRDLGFLAEFPGLRYLEVLDQQKVDTAPIAALSNLRGLRLNTPKNGLDFGCFPHLEVFVGDWHPDNRNVSRCDELRQLRIWKYRPTTSDLSELSGATRLEWLTVTQSDVRSLRGVEELEDLRYLSLAYVPKLESLDALRDPRCDLRELEVQNAKRIAGYDGLGTLSHLRRLMLSGCAPVADLEWIRGLDRLDFFSFVDTTVVDGDLSALLELPRLRYVGSMKKKTYSHDIDELNDLLRGRHEGEAPD